MTATVSLKRFEQVRQMLPAAAMPLTVLQNVAKKGRSDILTVYLPRLEEFFDNGAPVTRLRAFSRLFAGAFRSGDLECIDLG